MCTRLSWLFPKVHCPVSYIGYISRSLSGFQIAPVVRNLPANAGDTRDVRSIPGLGRSPGVGNGNLLSILAWRILWTGEPGGLQSRGCQRVRHN